MLSEAAGVQLLHGNRSAFEPALIAMRTAMDETAITEAWARERMRPVEDVVVEVHAVATTFASPACTNPSPVDPARNLPRLRAASGSTRTAPG